MSIKSIITAIDIDNNNQTIEKQVNEKVESFVRKKLSEKTRELKRINLLENPEYKLTSEAKNKIKEDILLDPEIESYRQYQFESIKQKSENYFVMRETLHNMNELNEFSSDIEKSQLQTINNFRKFEDLIKYSLLLSEKFKKYISIRNDNINNYIDSYDNKILPFNEDAIDLLIMLRDMYSITKNMDDLDIFDKFDMNTNIDISNKLGDIYMHKYKNESNNDSNIINDWYNDISNPVQKLSKKVIVTNKMLGILLLSNYNTNRTSFISNNSVTCFISTYITTANNERTFVTRTLGELLLDITNPDLEYIDKTQRQQIYSTYDGTRPSSEEYHKWNGLQVFDIDLKDWSLMSTHIDKFKKELYNELTKYHWFLWICKSASGNGLHIYTKVTPPHHIYTDIKENEYISKYWFNVNYTSKNSIIYDIIYKIHNSTRNSIRFDNRDFVDNFELRFVDNIVRRITAGIRLTWDNNILINNNFVDLHVSTGLDNNHDIMLRDTKFNKKIISYINEELVVGEFTEPKEKITETIDLSKYDFNGDITNIQALPRNMINYTTRYNVVNTLAGMFGKDGLVLAHKLLQSEVCKNVGEINSFYSCALSNKKKPSKIGLDILKKTGIIKSIKPEIKEYVDNIFKNGIRKAIENSINNQFDTPTIELQANEYLGDKHEILSNPLVGGFTNEKINILLSPPGSGKTQYLLKLAREGKKILLVEPFTSVIRNKVETDKDLMEIFQVFYNDFSLDKLEYGMNAIATFDKFSRCNYEKVSKMFDYICIDESHLLFTSSYRIDTTSSAIRKIKDLYYISSNDPFSAKIILMTGTETGDTYFFGDVGNVIRVTKNSTPKNVEFIIADDTLDCITRLSHKASLLINENYRLLIPTNKGEIYSQKLIGMVEHLLGRSVKYGYYKRSNSEQEICEMINKYNTVGDYEIIFCSNYLSVGVDIVDKHNFASLYFGPFSGFEIEQFNARIRRSSIKTIYCIQTEKNDGSTNDLLLEEPNLCLRLTEEDIENFADDKNIAKAKQEFIAEFDPVLHKIVTPGFSWLNGSIRFNKEEYELISYENKFLECMVHPVKVSRELSKYGYKIEVSNEYDGLSETLQGELKQIGAESAKNEKLRKHGLLVGTYIELINKNSHVTENGIEFNDTISWIMNNRDLIFENREQEEFLDFEYSLFGNPTQLTVKSKEALETMLKPAKYLISKYSTQKAIDIIKQYVDEAGILKQKHFKRAINLLKLIDRADSNDLAEPVFKTLEKLYDWLDKFAINKTHRISYNSYQADVDSFTNSYIDMLGIKINSTYGYQKIKDNIIELINDLATKNTSKDGIRFDYNKLPDSDGALAKHKKTVDTMIENMFNITTEKNMGNKRSRNTHVILAQQPF